MNIRGLRRSSLPPLGATHADGFQKKITSKITIRIRIKAGLVKRIGSKKTGRYILG